MRTVIVLNKDSREALAFVESHRLAGGDATAPVQHAEMRLRDGGGTTAEDLVLPRAPIGAGSRYVAAGIDIDDRRTDEVLHRYLPLGAQDPEWLGRGLGFGFRPGDRVELWYAAEGYAIDLRARRCYEYRAHGALEDEPDFLFGLDVHDCGLGLRLAAPGIGPVKRLEPLVGVAGSPLDPVDPTDLYEVCARHSLARSAGAMAVFHRVGPVPPGDRAAARDAFMKWVVMCVELDVCYPSEVSAVVCSTCGLGGDDTPWRRWLTTPGCVPAPTDDFWESARRRTMALAAKARECRAALSVADAAASGGGGR